MTDTGLPELPEGYLWRVRHRRIYNGFYVASVVDSGKLQVVLIRKWWETRHNIEMGTPWYRKASTYTESTEIESELFAEDCQGSHPIAVRNAANRIMKRWEGQKIRDSLIGDYPPKKLEVEND